MWQWHVATPYVCGWHHAFFRVSDNALLVVVLLVVLVIALRDRRQP